MAFRSTQPIEGTLDKSATFTAQEIALGNASSFGVLFVVGSGATVTFTLEGGSYYNGAAQWVDISGGVTLSGLTANARVDFQSGEFNGTHIRVACTAHDAGAPVSVWLDRLEP